MLLVAGSAVLVVGSALFVVLLLMGSEFGWGGHKGAAVEVRGGGREVGTDVVREVGTDVV